MPSRSKNPPNPLGIALSELLEERNLSNADFARLTGLSTALLSQIKHRKPSQLPKKVDIGRWAKVLKLTGEEKAAFQRVAELAYSPSEIQELLARQLLANLREKKK